MHSITTVWLLCDDHFVTMVLLPHEPLCDQGLMTTVFTSDESEA